MNYFFIDAETDGLYGRFLSVAVLVTDENGNELDRFYGAKRIDPEKIESQWVKENVLPHLKNAAVTYETEDDLLEAVWHFWMKHRESAFAVADVMHPVESRLFTECVRHSLSEREFLAPFPMLDLSTLLYVNKDKVDIENEIAKKRKLIRHDAFNDVRITAEVWLLLIKNLF